MPFKKINEYVKGGMKPKHAMAKVLGEMRHAKKMADGGMVKEGDYDLDEEHPRSAVNLMIQGDQPPVANPEVMDEEDKLASALMKAEEDSEYMAMGGLVEGSSDGTVGNKPSEDMSSKKEEPMPMYSMPAEAMSILMEKKKKRRFMK